MNDFVEQFKSVTEIPVAWGELDALNHVNNAVYFRYFETARIEACTKVGVLNLNKMDKIGPVLADTYAKYKRPVTFPDTLLVGISICQIESDRFTMEYTVFSKQQQAITTKGTSTIVMVDYASGRPVDIPSETMELLNEYSEFKAD
ncbi:acyl-CoA thioesterase [Parashewanella spongiae]|uniref:Acyl-CoA thioesterase n=1 Tax=Parashewanella spongiae TaxID=342950 RepID=A0A3A6UDS9_9GAMM|nr:thioesterase family protein [Parashewanella spongiae]MCL1077956.1 acyl-CoA thioesterase [Parashewanella spongiae]RJY16919.1 acyl-CoA thioesterase [Parashewanella spongiae]